MKNLRQLCMAVILTLMLTAHTFAGQMPTTVTDPQPPSSSAASMTTDGQINTLVAGQIHTTSSEVVDPVTEIAISLLQSVLPLF